MPLISKKIDNEYDVLVRMHVKVFLDRRDWKKAASKFLCRFSNSWRNRAVLQCQADETGRDSRSNHILNRLLKRSDFGRSVQMEQRFFQCRIEHRLQL